MNIASDFVLPSGFHHHILGTSICNDMLTNFKGYFESIDGGQVLKKASGWSSGYSLNVILSQMQIFFADPDMKMVLSENEIKRLVDYSNKYSCKDFLISFVNLLFFLLIYIFKANIAQLKMKLSLK